VLANALPQFPTDSLRRSKWPRNSAHSSSVGCAVFLGGAERAPAGDECPVVGDDFLGVGGFVAHGDVDVAVPGDDLGDVRRQPGHDRVGDEHPAEVVRGEGQGLPGGVRQPGAAIAALSIFRTVLGETARSSVPRRWNSRGAGGCQTFSCWS